MQAASERDEYVDIIWDNIKPGKENNFAKRAEDVVTQFGIPYDYGSVMHYSAKSFSVNGEETIVPIDTGATIGQRTRLSDKDAARIRAMYSCDDV